MEALRSSWVVLAAAVTVTEPSVDVPFRGVTVHHDAAAVGTLAVQSPDDLNVMT